MDEKNVDFPQPGSDQNINTIVKFVFSYTRYKT